MDNQWVEIEKLFEVASGLPRNDRSKYLIAASGNDHRLRDRVQALLDADEGAGITFLTPPRQPVEIDTFASTPEPGNDPLLGIKLKSFKIIELIARGGMGAVYVAEQENPCREVALKIMTASFWSRSAQRRFEFETETLGRLHHPNIAQVYEAGTHRLETGAALHYFAMEYIPGAARITDYCDEHRLDTLARLRLFCAVCNAVHYGHQKGVIHRDLKPGNILVGGDSPHALAIVKIIDFGIARSTDSDIAITTMHTEAGQLLGTLAYMSPEQAGGAPADRTDIDTRSDVYSLGVVLFELLTKKLPYDLSHLTIHAATRVICEQEPARPSTIRPGGAGLQAVLGDLETIILKCLEKDPAKRYSSAAALVEDVERHLRGEPITACPPTAWMRALRWAARHPKTAAGVGSAAVAVLIVAATLVTVQIALKRPSRIELRNAGQLQVGAVREGNDATLYSLAGGELETWSLGRTSSITLAELVARPSTWGDGKVFVLGLRNDAASQHRGRLCAFDANGPYENAIWSKTIEQDVIDAMPRDAWPRPSTDPNREYRSDGFDVKCAALFDIFPDVDHPGPEIVAYFMHHPGSQGVLRIYNLNGEVLFQAWQDGGINDMYWMSGPGLLVCAAYKGDQDRAEHHFDISANHPQVLFAIRPVAGDITKKWIYPFDPKGRPRFDNDIWQGEWYEPSWYKLPCPIRFADGVHWALRLREPSGRKFPATDFADVWCKSSNSKTSVGDPFSFDAIIDSQGFVRSHQPLADDSANVRPVPDPDFKTFDLLPWTEPNPPCGSASTQPATDKDPEARPFRDGPPPLPSTRPSG